MIARMILQLFLNAHLFPVRTSTTRSRRWWRWASSRLASSTATRWSPGAIWPAWRCCSGSSTSTSSFPATRTSSRRLRMRTSSTSTLVRPLEPTAHWKSNYTAMETGLVFILKHESLLRSWVVATEHLVQIQKNCTWLTLQHSCLVSSQQHHPFFRINGHPGVHCGDVRLSADQWWRQGGANRVQEVLEGSPVEFSVVAFHSISHQGAAVCPAFGCDVQPVSSLN